LLDSVTSVLRPVVVSMGIIVGFFIYSPGMLGACLINP